MGIGFVLIVYVVLGLVAALVGGGVCRRIAGLLVPAGAPSREKLVRFATAFPALCLAWASCVFVFQGAVNSLVLHRDIGLGDVFKCPLPGGYQLTCIDDTEIGAIEAVKGGERLDWVREMQFSGHFLLVAEEDEWHIIDTTTQQDEAFRNRVDFEKAARKRQIQIRLEPVGSFYSRYRFTWFDAFAGFLLIAAPVGLMLALGRDIRLARQKNDALSSMQ